MQDESVREELCSLCSSVPQADRAAFREEIDRIPVKEPVCDGCLAAFFRNIGFQVEEEPKAH